MPEKLYEIPEQPSSHTTARGRPFSFSNKKASFFNYRKIYMEDLV